MDIFDKIDYTTARMVGLFPKFYHLLRQILKDINDIDESEIVILQLIRAKGGKAKRPIIWGELAIDSKKYAYKATHLIQHGLIQSQRQGRESIDILTEQGNQKFEEIKSKLELFISSMFSLLNDEERKTVIAAIEILDTLSRRMEDNNDQ